MQMIMRHGPFPLAWFDRKRRIMLAWHIELYHHFNRLYRRLALVTKRSPQGGHLPGDEVVFDRALICAKWRYRSSFCVIAREHRYWINAESAVEQHPHKVNLYHTHPMPLLAIIDHIGFAWRPFELKLNKLYIIRYFLHNGNVCKWIGLNINFI